MAEAKAATQQAATTIRTAHPDVARAVAAANTDRLYHVLRINCMDGTYAEYHEKAKNDPQHVGSKSPVGELCIGLLRNSADVNASPERLEKRPETSLLAPYLAMAVTRNFSPSLGNASALADEFVRRADLPENKNTAGAVNFGKATPPFLLSPGVALDAAFTQTVLKAQAPNSSTPPIPSRNLDELYNTTDSCFRNTGVTIGQCVDAGRDQAALYLNKESTVSQASMSGSPRPQQSKRTRN